MMRTITSRLSQHFSQIKVPIVDVKNYLTGSPLHAEDCKIVADSFKKYGCLVIKDPRVQPENNNRFLDMMERYFQKRSMPFYQSKSLEDLYPQYNYQVGATPQYTEKARDHPEILKAFSKENKAFTSSPPPYDAKWRYFWNIGNVTSDVEPNQVPKDFPEFEEVMESWGSHMINGCFTVAEMAAIGLGFEKNTFTAMMERGPHKLAPTGSDLMKYKVGTVFAGFHYDFNFLTIHGKSRYPGLFAWLRTGERFTVQVPQGHLLLQAGKEFEWLTGGEINCGFHEVIYTEQVEEAKQKALKEGRIPWRISSTLFSHIRSDVLLEPLGKFKQREGAAKYPPILAKDYALQELEAIKLKA